MRLIITWTIKKTELLRWKRVFSLKVVKQAARKALGDIKTGNYEEYNI